MSLGTPENSAMQKLSIVIIIIIIIKRDKTHFSVADFGFIRLMWLFGWFWWYLWPKRAFKVSQEFPTASLDIIIIILYIPVWTYSTSTRSTVSPTSAPRKCVHRYSETGLTRSNMHTDTHKYGKSHVLLQTVASFARYTTTTTTTTSSYIALCYTP